MSNWQIHKECFKKIQKGGISHFVCRNCGQQAVNFLNGTNLCQPCCEKLFICQICGKELNLKDQFCGVNNV